MIISETLYLILTTTPDGVAPYGRGDWYLGRECVTFQRFPKEEFDTSEFCDDAKYEIFYDPSWRAGLHVDLVDGDDPCGHQNAPLGSHNDPTLDQAPAMPSRHQKSGSVVDMWLVDTGCGHDLVGRKDYSLRESNLVHADVPLTFATANGYTPATYRYPLFLEEIGYEIAPYVLKDTPAVLTVGGRVMNEDFSFFWPSCGIPYYLAPDGRMIELQVIDDIPYLLSGTVPRDVEFRDIDLLLSYLDLDCMVYTRWQPDSGIPQNHPAAKRQCGRNPLAAVP